MADMRTRVALVVLAVAGGTLFAGAFVASGGNSPGTPGGDLSFYGTLTDKTTGETFQVSLNANEDPNQAGVGGMFFQLNGPNISACDAHGEGAQSGSTPLATMQCGGSGNISVAVDGCGATLETHGITHADHPWTVYLGPMTLDVTFTYNARQGSGNLVIEMYTPKTVLKIAGPTNGSVTMSTCT